MWASRGDDDEIALNNRALSREMQFACTGELVLLEAAVTDFAASVRMQPDDTIAVANYASALAHLAYARLLSRWMDLEQFPPPRWVSRPIVRRLARGPRRDRLTAFARSDIVESARGQLGRHHVLAPNAQQVDRDEVLFAELDSSLDPLRVLARRARHTLSADDARPDRPDDAERARAESDLRTARHWQTQATDAETSGAAYISQGIATEWVARLDADPRRFNEARRHFEAAEAAWPDLEVRHDLVRLLVAEAIAEVIAESAALKRRFIDEDWAKVPMLFAARLQDEPEARRRIIAHPQTQRALRIARTIPVGEESADLWMLGDLAGDEDLLRDHAAVFADPRAAMLVEIRARLSRFVSVQARWAFMKSRLHSAATIRD